MKVDEGKEITPRPFRSSRWIAWGLAGLAWFLWIGYEDQGLTAVLIVSGVIAFAFGLEAYSRLREYKYLEGTLVGRLFLFIRGIGIGALSGALVGPIVLLLTTLKNSLHQHGGADFSTDQLILILDHIAFWTLAGGLFGTAASLYELSKSGSQDEVPLD